MAVAAYYNEFDPYAAEWLRNLIDAGHLPAGDVDTRSIKDVRAYDLKGYTQCHFFAGIGGWPYALRLAGWPDDRQVWTGSCPCQPFSVAGQGKGTTDERHLWPTFCNLIYKSKPPVVFGEQVAAKAGREWLDRVRADLEGMGYAIGAADLCAAGAGAPHIRQRLWWLADANGGNTGTEGLQRSREHGQQPEDGETGGLGIAIGTGLEGQSRHGNNRSEPGRIDTQQDGSVAAASTDGFWSDFDIIPCADGKARRIESGTFPLAHGVSARVGKLRAYGNAIVPQVAAEFIEAYNEACMHMAGE